MSYKRKPLFSFSEDSHLMRIHLRLKLEDLGFHVEEDASELTIVAPSGEKERGKR